MATDGSQDFTQLQDDLYNDPSLLSQYLAQRAASTRVLHFTDSTTTRPSAGTATDSGIGAGPEGVAPSESPAVHAPPLRDPTAPPARRAPHHDPPRFQKHHSDPSATTAAAAPPKERHGMERLHHTFAADGPGDTQPDSQLWSGTTFKLANSSVTGQHQPTSLLHDVREDDDDSSNEHTDEVHVVGSSQEKPPSDYNTSPMIVHGDNDPDTQFRLEPLPTSPLKFETPALAGKKRDSQGHVLSSGMRTTTTPGTDLKAAFFDAGGNAGFNPMSLSQVFNATQAATSPARGHAVADLSEDAVFQRPSPNFTNFFTRPGSSPAPATSSPTKAMRSDPLVRSSSEPRAEYVTMQESQDRREQERRAANLDRAEMPDSFEEPTEAEKRAMKRRAKERFEREASKSYASVTAPARPRAGGRKKKLLSTATPKNTNSAVARTPRRSMYDGPYDDESADELQSPHEHVNAEEHDDSPDELSQQLLSSVQKSLQPPNTKKTRSTTTAKVQVPNTSSHPHPTLSGRAARNSSPKSPSSQLQRESQGRAKSSNSRATMTIADSQPEPVMDTDSIPRPGPMPSSPSQNKYPFSPSVLTRKTGYTSQVVESSQVPMPPATSSPHLDEEEQVEERGSTEGERVPSSPPALVPEDEITYDEHSVGGHDSDIEVGGPVDGDVEMGEDHEVAETVDGVDAEADVLRSEEEDLIRSSHPEDAASSPDNRVNPNQRLQRQSTIPESDLLEDTQLQDMGSSMVADDDNTHMTEAAPDATLAANEMNNTGPFHTAQEDQSPSVPEAPTREPHRETREDAAASNLARFRSLSDIAAQPDTQHSMDVDSTEFPVLPVDDMNDELGTMLGAPPARPAKKRKTVYSSKRKQMDSFSPAKDSAVTTKQVSSPLKQVERVREELTSSPSRREETSAPSEEAVSPKPATLKRGRLTRPAKTPQPNRAGALKPVNKSGSAKPSIRRQDALFTQRYEVGETPARPADDEADMNADVGPSTPKFDATVEDAESPDELAGPPNATPHLNRVFNITRHSEPSKGDIIAPNRVFARWPGDLVFYPATCLGWASRDQLSIRYDDGNIHTLEADHVRAFDLQIGDLIKVNQPRMKTPIYVVAGFEDRLHAVEDDEFPLTDCHGYRTVVLEVKQRDSLPKVNSELSRKTLKVSLEHVYFTAQLWNKSYVHKPKFVPAMSLPSHTRLGTPATTDGAASPLKASRGVAGLRASVNRAASVASSARSGNLFANMAFALTFTQDATGKDALVHLITSNGGMVLEDGFHTLFEDVETPVADVPPASSAKSKSKGKAKTKVTAAELVIRPEFRELGFVALLTDSHNRRAKYMQALALNLPCLHFRWLHDSIRNGTALSSSKYLLPAGVSTFFTVEGVVRSRSMELFDPTSDEASFARATDRRERFLHDQSFLILVPRNKAAADQKQAYLFLIHALGPRAVGRCEDLDAMRFALEHGNWDWACVDKQPPKSDEVQTTSQILFGSAGATKKATQAGKKRKQDNSTEAESLVRKGHLWGKDVKVVWDEFLVQSLILGALVEE